MPRLAPLHVTHHHESSVQQPKADDPLFAVIHLPISVREHLSIEHPQGVLEVEASVLQASLPLQRVIADLHLCTDRNIGLQAAADILTTDSLNRAISFIGQYTSMIYTETRPLATGSSKTCRTDPLTKLHERTRAPSLAAISHRFARHPSSSSKPRMSAPPQRTRTNPTSLFCKNEPKPRRQPRLFLHERTQASCFARTNPRTSSGIAHASRAKLAEQGDLHERTRALPTGFARTNPSAAFSRSPARPGFGSCPPRAAAARRSRRPPAGRRRHGAGP